MKNKKSETLNKLKKVSEPEISKDYSLEEISALKNLKNLLKKLESKKVITKYPNPIYPFLLAFLSLVILLFIIKTTPNLKLLIIFSLMLTVFSFIFAILHLIVVLILENR